MPPVGHLNKNLGFGNKYLNMQTNAAVQNDRFIAYEMDIDQKTLLRKPTLFPSLMADSKHQNLANSLPTLDQMVVDDAEVAVRYRMASSYDVETKVC